ncbi:AVT7 [Symbiodinium necroappetens]|nr:AVT7 [Symbiodinium necroappetens]CAE7820254.1 AVT7 [Symbiodinium sp. KB8]CAE7852523.1 AVT7 [Symbiodinium microadriaticum]
MTADITKPLLGKNGNKSTEVGSTVTATVINLLKNMVGAGLLNVCVAFQYASVLGGLLIMLFSAFVCTGGFLLIGYCCSKTQAKTFRELWRSAMGQNTEKTVDVVLFFHTLFSCVGYVTMIGDFCIKSASGLMPDSVFARRRESSILVISLFGIFPLCLYKNLEPLKYTSVVGLFITAISCAYIFYDVVANAEEYHAVETLRDNMWYVKLDMFKTLALFNGSFSAHYNAPTYYAELKEKSFLNYMRVSFWAFGIATLLFTAFGLAGFARFGDEVLGNVLKSYSPDDPMIQISWFCMMVSTVFNFPHAFQRMRSSFNALINRGPEDNFLVTTIALLGLSVYMGVAFKDIAVIKMIKGATLGVSIMFIFPALFFLQLNQPIQMKRKCSGDVNDPNSKFRRRRRGNWLRVLCVIMMITGFVQGLLALLVHYKVI